MAVASDVDESLIKTAEKTKKSSSSELALILALAKARAVSKRYPYSYVLGADQILECDGFFFDKPQTLNDARTQLIALRGRDHQLINSLVVVKDNQLQWQHTAIARLTMRNFSESFLDTYLAAVGDAILGSPGGYHLEGMGSQLFETIDGDYFTILGLPLLPLLAYLRQIHILAD